MNNNSSKQILLSVLGVAILVVAVVGVSFAAFTFSDTQDNKENTITTGAITLTYQESENGISITNMMPTKDTTGKALTNDSTDVTGGSTNVFDFEISADIKGKTTINYTVSAKKQDSTLDDKYAKLYLETISELGASTGVEKMAPKTYQLDADPKVDSNGRPADEMTLTTGSFTASANHYYRLKMWVDESYVPDGTSKSFTVKVNVYAKAA